MELHSAEIRLFLLIGGRAPCLRDKPLKLDLQVGPHLISALILLFNLDFRDELIRE